MKMKSLFFAALVVFGSAVAFAGNGEPGNTGLAVVPVKGTEVYKVIYKGETAGKVRLNIYNASGALILSERIAAMNGFIVPVNFTGLSEGDYTIELVDSKGSQTEKVSIKAETLKNVYISRLTSDRSKFLLSVPNSGNETITVKIYDNENNLLLSDSKEINGDFAQVFKVTSPTAGYTFEVKNAAGSTKTIKF